LTLLIKKHAAPDKAAVNVEEDKEDAADQEDAPGGLLVPEGQDEVQLSRKSERLPEKSSISGPVLGGTLG